MNERATITKRHERGVEGFYATGVNGFHDYHAGYLNFGYWTRPGMTYIEAAENLIHTMGTTLELNAQSIVLDVGCGMGTQDVYLTHTFTPRSIDGLDVTLKHVERSAERATRAGIGADRLRFQHGSGTALPFPDIHFTHLLSIEAAEHFDTREDFFKEAFRVLKPRGVLVLTDYLLARPARHLWDILIIAFARLLWHVPKANLYGNEVMKTKLEAAGFKNVHIQNIGAQVIPGYYFEHRKPSEVALIKKIRGFWGGVVGGFLIDVAVYRAFTYGLCEYVIVRAEK